MNRAELEEWNRQHLAGWECPKCGLRRESDCGPDPCLGMLPGVKFACCGHGGVRSQDGYIFFTNGKVIRFKTLTEVAEHNGPILFHEHKVSRTNG